MLVPLKIGAVGLDLHRSSSRLVIAQLLGQGIDGSRMLYQIYGVLKRTAFIVPSARSSSVPAVGPEWLHEVKHDGWRAQLHRHDAGATILSKSGKDISGRFAVIGSALRSLPPCVIDAEIVGCDADGIPDFRSLWRATPRLLRLVLRSLVGRRQGRAPRAAGGAPRAP